MRFTDLLKTTVMLSAGAATMLAVLTLIGAGNDEDDRLALICASWWCVSSLIGAWLGRTDRVNPAIGRLLADAKQATTMPEIRPTAVLLNRLWPLLVTAVVAGALAFLSPQLPGIATGFTIIWALAWRRQEAAVRAVEERDGMTFFVEQTSPIRPISLLRMPGLRREVPQVDAAA